MVGHLTNLNVDYNNNNNNDDDERCVVVMMMMMMTASINMKIDNDDNSVYGHRQLNGRINQTNNHPSSNHFGYNHPLTRY
ncbi:hypothetical protein DERF_003272 [Dermatophagoides farinae]|uniref:Uncharacterized protein n=1 Tax=Dermatophagoides farinae TaxID=6954 RepID=A0A922IDY1_DERFA|nr:hypothetical protein DERF_003272 [Dermatophagoides farinae]